ncbi:MAG TPA: WD40 repeat domain-containing serine/threonine protein kinase, partial [Ktedonosporobacter sp.]|nr:WD40 repeat domain-containing serine/threonine protein kinase [Ktedonosporobacter sp.]
MIQNLIGEALGHYRILQSIEQGGMASVFLARDIHIQREVAIKVFQPQQDQERTSAFLHRFTREAQIVGRLDHPNILQVYDYGEQDGLAYLVMPYLANGSLKRLLAERGRVPVPGALQIISQLLEALQYAHEQGLIHRDIKPGNILFKNNYTPVLADFGLVKEIATGEAFIDGDDGPIAGRQPTLSSSLIMGTPYYIAPEQIRGRVQPASDIYSTGVVLYEMLTGQHPLIRERTTETMQILLKQLNEPPLPIRTLNPAIPPHLSDAIMRTLEKDPALRYQSPLDLLQALRVTEASGDLAPSPIPAHQRVYETLPFDDGIITTPPEEMTNEIAMSDENRTVAISEELRISEPVVRRSDVKITRRWIVGTLISGGVIAGLASLSQPAFQRYFGHAVSPTSTRTIPAQATTIRATPVQTSAAQQSGKVPSTKQAKLIYRGHTYDIKVVAWSSFSGGALIASTDGNSVHVWRAQDGVRLFSSDDQTGDLANANLILGAMSNGDCDLAWSPVDPRELAFFVSSQDNQHTPYLWKQNFLSAEAGSVNSMGPVIQLNMAEPYSFAWSPDGYYIAIGSTQGVTILPNGKGDAVWNYQQNGVIVGTV